MDASNGRGGEHGEGGRSEVEIAQSITTRATIRDSNGHSVPVRFIAEDPNNMMRAIAIENNSKSSPIAVTDFPQIGLSFGFGVAPLNRIWLS